ncbi:MAG: chemotaxis protein CheW [Micavibrio sp.]|nr:chemotaxis protein CheW [Micavibrio sp.]|tara:strand:- start:674 stop:1162 length:489 start_codon:yes stop_codon:yes gene_type:complete
MSAQSAYDDVDAIDNNALNKDFLTMTIADQLFGIPVLQVQDVLREQRVTKVPLAPPEVSGSLNLRGRVVTAINMRKRLGLPERTKENGGKDMSVVVEHDNELFSLTIDKVGDVLSLPRDNFESNPATLDPLWMSVSSGIYRLENRLMVVLDVPKLLGAVQDP